MKEGREGWKEGTRVRVHKDEQAEGGGATSTKEGGGGLFSFYASGVACWLSVRPWTGSAHHWY